MKAAKGHVFKYGDNVDTDVIIPARYLNSSDPKELALHCMEDIDKDFVKNVKAGDIMVANKNFGCGSSREHAPISIKAAGVSCVIAETFARISSVINAFCQTIRNSGYTPGLYANKNWLTEKINTGALGGCKIWLAQYVAAPTYGGRYEMWQYSSRGSIAGIKGNVDLNVSYMGY